MENFLDVLYWVIDLERVKRISVLGNIFQRCISLFKNPKLNLHSLKLINNSGFLESNPDFLSTLKNRSKMEKLVIFQNTITKMVCKPLEFTNLRFLKLNSIQSMFSDGIVKMNSSKLDSIAISSAKELKGDWGEIPNLRSLIIMDCPKFKCTFFHTNREFLKLKWIMLYSIGETIDLSKWKLKCENLNRISLFDCKVKNFFSSSHLFTNVELMEIGEIIDHFQHGQSCSFKNLKKLKLDVAKKADLTKFIHNNKFPILENFLVECQSFDLDNYFYFLDHKPPKLHKILITHPRFNELFNDYSLIEFPFALPNPPKDKEEKQYLDIFLLNMVDIKEKFLTRKIILKEFGKLEFGVLNSKKTINRFLAIFKFPNVTKIEHLSNEFDVVVNGQGEHYFNQIKIDQHFPQLEQLKFNAEMNDKFFRINQFRNLRKLKLFSGTYEGKNWNELKILELLEFNKCTIGNNLFVENYFPNLEVLLIVDCKIKNDDIGENWKVFPKLDFLEINHTKFSNKPFQDTIRFPGLTELVLLGDLQMKKEIGKNWVQFITLETLIYDGEDSIEHFRNQKKFPKLKRIERSYEE